MSSPVGLRSLVLLGAGLSLMLDQAAGLECKRDVLGTSVSISCPLPQNPSDKVFCCPKYYTDSQCCSMDDLEDIEDLDWDDFEDFMDQADEGLDKVMKFIGITFGGVILLAVMGLTCCCCLPCCLLSKRRRRGQTHGPATALEAQPMAGRYPTQAANTGFRQQQQGYPQMQPQQPGYPSQQPGYPSQQPGCPPMQPCFQDNPPPYPGPPLGQAAAEPYPTKQPAFNPNAV